MRRNNAASGPARWLGTLVLVLWLAVAGTGIAHAAEAMMPASGTRPFRIALVPVIDATGGWLDNNTATNLMLRLDQELHIPLNHTMHWAEYLPEDDCGAALKAEMKERGPRARLRDVIQPLAARLNADLLIAVEVTSFSEWRYFSWEGEMVIETSTRLTLYGYDAAQDRLIKKTAGGFDVNDYHPSYEAGPKLLEALDDALAEANLRSLLPPRHTTGQAPTQTPGQAPGPATNRAPGQVPSGTSAV